MILTEMKYVHGDTVVSHKYRFVWICVPKVASRTMLSLFSDHYKGSNPCEGTRLVKIPDWRDRLADVPADYFSFAFVRNPYERVASVWLDKISNFRAVVKEESHTKARNRSLFDKYPELSPNTKFDEFVHWLGPTIRPSDDPHWKAQSLFVSDKSGRLAVDYVGKLERLEQDLAHVRNKLGLPSKKIPQLNGRNAEWRVAVPTAYDEFYTPELRDIIRRRYAIDFEMFGYPPDSYVDSRRPPVGQTGTVDAELGEVRRAVPRS